MDDVTEPDSPLEVVQLIAEVVVLRVTSGGLVPVEGDAPIDLAVAEPLPAPLVGQLLDSRVRLIAPTDVPYELVEAIEQQPLPPAFADNPWLSRYRALVFDQDQCTIRGFCLRYSRRFGVLIDESEDHTADS